jgi:hypothetical protein
MKYEVTNIKSDMPSKYGGVCTLITFKRIPDGKSYASWIASNCRNSARWDCVRKAGVGAIVTNLVTKGDALINADSYPKITTPETNVTTNWLLMDN